MPGTRSTQAVAPNSSQRYDENPGLREPGTGPGSGAGLPPRWWQDTFRGQQHVLHDILSQGDHGARSNPGRGQRTDDETKTTAAATSIPTRSQNPAGAH